MRESYSAPTRTLNEALQSCDNARRAASRAARKKPEPVATLPAPATARAVGAAVDREAGKKASHTGSRFAIALICLHDGTLRPATRCLFADLCWFYRPGRLFRDWAARVGECAIAPRAARRARAELASAGYIANVDSGIIVPAIEALLPPARRYQSPAARQREFPFLAPAPDGAAQSARRFLADRMHR